MVSSMLSPFTREDSCTSRFTTSAPSRLAASSNDTRVRVEGSVNRLATVMPARLLARAPAASPTGLHEFLRAREQALRSAASVMPSSVSRCRSVPFGAGLFASCVLSVANQRSRITAAAAASTSSRVTRRLRSPLARCARRRSSASCEDQRSSDQVDGQRAAALRVRRRSGARPR